MAVGRGIPIPAGALPALEKIPVPNEVGDEDEDEIQSPSGDGAGTGWNFTPSWSTLTCSKENPIPIPDSRPRLLKKNSSSSLFIINITYKSFVYEHMTKVK